MIVRPVGEKETGNHREEQSYHSRQHQVCTSPGEKANQPVEDRRGKREADSGDETEDPVCQAAASVKPLHNHVARDHGHYALPPEPDEKEPDRQSKNDADLAAQDAEHAVQSCNDHVNSGHIDDARPERRTGENCHEGCAFSVE